jgi:hypothetical protein
LQRRRISHQLQGVHVPAKAANPDHLTIIGRDGETEVDARSTASLSPTIQASVTIKQVNKDFGEIALNAIVTELARQCEVVANGDLTRAETLLTAQAHTLDSLFNNLARRAAVNIGEHVHAADAYLRLALRAQNQCRMTVETLNEIKNPRSPTFVRASQANIAGGHQQVNNGAAAGEAQISRAGEKTITPSKLLEATDGERVECGAPMPAGRSDPSLAPMGEVHGSADTPRQIGGVA